MSDDLDNYDDDLDDADAAPDTAPKGETPGWRKRLENKAKTATERAEAAERKLAFHEAGIDPKTDKRLAFFIENYRGDTSADAVKAAALEAGFIEAEAAEAEQQIPDSERAAHQRAAANATGESAGAYGYDAAIAEATAAGNHLGAIALKQQKSAAQRGAKTS